VDTYAFADRFDTRDPRSSTLEPGATLLEEESDHAPGPLKTLTADQLLLDGGTALWVARGRHCVTPSLAILTPVGVFSTEPGWPETTRCECHFECSDVPSCGYKHLSYRELSL
jgi:hypothetical protein